jgi:hypothetical protein
VYVVICYSYEALRCECDLGVGASENRIWPTQIVEGRYQAQSDTWQIIGHKILAYSQILHSLDFSLQANHFVHSSWAGILV